MRIRFVLAIALIVFAGALPAQAQEITNLYVGDGPVYIDLATGTAVAAADRTETNWDLVIDGVDVRPNGAGILIETPFADLTTAPEEGFGDGAFVSATGKRWYQYDPDSHFIWAVPGLTMVAGLKDGSFVKLEITSYYNLETDEPRWMSFHYARSEAGSRTF